MCLVSKKDRTWLCVVLVRRKLQRNQRREIQRKRTGTGRGGECMLRSEAGRCRCRIPLLLLRPLKWLGEIWEVGIYCWNRLVSCGDLHDPCWHVLWLRPLICFRNFCDRKWVWSLPFFFPKLYCKISVERWYQNHRVKPNYFFLNHNKAWT